MLFYQDFYQTPGELHKPGKMTEILNRRNFSSFPSIISQAPLKPLPPMPQLGGDEVDDAESMDFRFEQARLDSYEGWPVPFVNPADLARAGFYYTKQIDRVKCFECSTEICKWEDGDDPMTEHQRWGGRCRFIRKLPCGNVPIGVDPNTVPLPIPRSMDVCGPYGLDYRLTAEDDTNPSPSTYNLLTTGKLPSTTALGSLGLGIPKRPDFPEYGTYEARLATFDQWPTSLAQKKEDLANAGFIYTKIGDQTTCYHCGGGLKNWEPQDDPWVQHAKWFSKCYFVQLNKGQEFINSVTGKHVTPLSEEETKKMNLPSYIKKIDISVPHKDSNIEESKPGSSTENLMVDPSKELECTSSQTSTKSEDSAFSSQGSNASLESNSSKKNLDDARTCKICYNEELGVVFLPCGHIVTCVKCAPGMATCAVCRKPVTMTVRAFFS